MEDFVASPIFKTYALCSALLLGKMMVLSIMTSRQRIKHGKFSNKEDAVAAGLKASNQYDLKQALESDDDIERIRRAHMNDMENIYPFLVIGLLFAALSSNEDKYTSLHFYIFTFFRFAHTLVYVNAVKQPARAICFLINWFCLVSMIVQVIMKTM